MKLPFLLSLMAAAPVAAPPAVDPHLAEELRLAVEMLQPQLPLKLGPDTITNLEARGVELIFHMDVAEDVDARAFPAYQERLSREACSNPQMAGILARGGAYTYRVKDSEGEVFTAAVARC